MWPYLLTWVTSSNLIRSRGGGSARSCHHHRFVLVVHPTYFGTGFGHFDHGGSVCKKRENKFCDSRSSGICKKFRSLPSSVNRSRWICINYLCKVDEGEEAEAAPAPWGCCSVVCCCCCSCWFAWGGSLWEEVVERELKGAIQLCLQKEKNHKW